MGSNLSVLSLNIWNVNEPFDERMHIFSKFLQTETPDVICLQEFPIRGGRPTMLALFETNGYTCVHLPTGDVLGHEEGLAICVRDLPTKTVGAVPLPGGSGDLARAALAVQLKMSNSDRIFVITTHLAYRPEQSLIRRAQALEIAQMISRLWSNFGRMPTIIAGDFNCLADVDVLDILANPTDDAQLVDLQSKSGQAKIFTFSAENPYVSPDLWPNRRIDYILATPDWSLSDFQVVFDAGSPYGFASDHYGLLAKIRLVGP